MPHYDPRQAVIVANEIYEMVETKGDHERGLLKMCGLLHALDAGVVSDAGLRRRADFARLVSAIPSVSGRDFADFLADRGNRDEFLRVERQLLEEAGTASNLVTFVIEQVERNLGGGASDAGRRDFEKAVRRLRDLTCERVTGGAVVRAAVAGLRKQVVRRETIMVVAGMVTTAVDVPLYDVHPIAAAISMNLGCNIVTSSVESLFPRRDEEEDDGGMPVA